MPASELVPGMVEISIQGIDGLVWVDPAQLQPGEIQHPPFADEVRECIRQIQSSFQEHRALSFEEWEDGFRRDTNPAQEIALWLYAAGVYSEFADLEPSPERRKDVYRCVVACLTASPDTVWHVLRPSVLSKDEAAQVVRRYYGNGEASKDAVEPR